MQAVPGFVDREGGSFYQEWSALFVMEGSHGERIFFHYPRLQSMSGAEEIAIPLSSSKNQNGQSRVLLKAQFLALPVIVDPLGRRAGCLLPELFCQRQMRLCDKSNSISTS